MGRSVPDPRKIVLVVEDEPILRMMAVDLVEEAGFEAVEAADADEALKILEARPDIRIVFTDIDMPRGIDGIRLAKFVRDRWPPIKIIVTSGKITPEEGELPDDILFVSKPYRHHVLVSELRKIGSGIHG